MSDIEKSDRNINHDETNNRSHDGDDISPDLVNANTVNASESITDPEGNTVTSLSDPVRVTEETSTFTEDDVSLTSNSTTESERLVTSRVNDSDSFTGIQERRGVRIKANKDFDGLEFRISDNTAGISSIRLEKASGELLASFTSGTISAGDTFTLFPDSTIKSGDELDLVADADGNNYEAGFADPGFPVTGQGLDIIDGIAGGSATVPYNFNDITSVVPYNHIQLAGSNKSGDALIAWGSGAPDDINSWDLVTFQRTLDGETVTVDVEDSTGTVLKSDISKDTDISDIPTATDVQLRANLSRNDTSNNPALDYLARRFTR